MGNNTPDTDISTERISKLPDEILASQQCRSDYLKWKLLLVATLGAAGLGLGEKGKPVLLLLALIPFVCLYVDLLCTNLKLRIIVIGNFYATIRKNLYEQFVKKQRNVFRMEDWALYWSTYVICLILILIGSISQTSDPLLWQQPTGGKLILVLAGSVGIGLSLLIQIVSNMFENKIEPPKKED